MFGLTQNAPTRAQYRRAMATGSTRQERKERQSLRRMNLAVRIMSAKSRQRQERIFSQHRNDPYMRLERLRRKGLRR